MIARYETKAPKGGAHITAHRYMDLQNLPHWHTEYELVFADSRTAEVQVGGAVYTLTEENCLFIPSGEVHYIKGAPGSVLSVIKIDPELLDDAFERRIPTAVQHPRPQSAAAVFEEIAAELRDGAPYAALIADSRTLCLLAVLFRSAPLQDAPHHRSGADEAYKQLLQQIAERFADMTFSEAAAFMCFSEPYFSKYFRRMSGMHFTDYLNLVRVHEAVRLLHTGGCSVTEIALRTGFGTIRSFNRVFRKVTGYTPRTLPADFICLSEHSDGEEGVDPTVSAVILI